MPKTDRGTTSAALALVLLVVLSAVFVGWLVYVVVEYPFWGVFALLVLAALAVHLVRVRLPRWEGFQPPAGVTFSPDAREIAGDLPGALPVEGEGTARNALVGNVRGRRVVCFEWVRPRGRRDWVVAMPIEKVAGEFAAPPGSPDLADPEAPSATKSTRSVTVVTRDGCAVWTLTNPSPRRALRTLREHGAYLREEARKEDVGGELPEPRWPLPGSAPADTVDDGVDAEQRERA